MRPHRARRSAFAALVAVALLFPLASCDTRPHAEPEQRTHDVRTHDVRRTDNDRRYHDGMCGRCSTQVVLRTSQR
jgi:hypothetical protein